MQNSNAPNAEGYRVADQMMTVQQVADLIGANAETVRVWIRAELLPAVFFGGAVGYRIQRSDYERFVASRKGAQGLALARRNHQGGFDQERNGEHR